MSTLEPFELAGADGKRFVEIVLVGKDRQILFITGFLSKRWGNKSKALAQWCEEKGWGFCCYDVRGFGDSEGTFTDYTLSDWIADARLVLNMLREWTADYHSWQFARWLDRLAHGAGVSGQLKSSFSSLPPST